MQTIELTSLPIPHLTLIMVELSPTIVHLGPSGARSMPLASSRRPSEIEVPVQPAPDRAAHKSPESVFPGQPQ